MVQELETKSLPLSAKSDVFRKGYLINEFRRKGIDLAKQGKNKAERAFLDEISGKSDRELVSISRHLNSQLPSSKVFSDQTSTYSQDNH